MNIPATARSVSASGSVTPPNHRAPMATTGRAMRAMTFQTPVTIADVDVARREKPQVRQMPYVAASPTAPPPGRRLETEDPQRLTMSALLWLSPCREPVMQKV